MMKPPTLKTRVSTCGEAPGPKDTLLNVNMPSVPAAEIRGLKLTRLGRRVYSNSLQAMKDPWGRDYIYRCPGEHGDYDGHVMQSSAYTSAAQSRRQCVSTPPTSGW